MVTYLIFAIPVLALACCIGYFRILVFNCGRRPLVRIAAVLLSLAVCATAWWTTYRYKYWVDPNTEFHGWPVPTVVFQRESPDSPFLDFVGLGIVIGWPLNTLLLLGPIGLVVVLVNSIAKYAHHRRTKRSNEN